MGAEDKKSFLLYHDYAVHIAKLSDEDAGKLFKAVFDYVEGGEIPSISPAADMAFSFIAAQLDRDRQKYEHKCEVNAVNGRKGGRPAKRSDLSKTEKTERLSKKAKKADNDTDTDNENENDTDIDNDTVKPEPHGSKPARHKYGEYKNVLLSDDEIEKLKAEIPDYQSYIERLSGYMASSGRTYKNYLATIRNWARKDSETNRTTDDTRTISADGGLHI